MLFCQLFACSVYEYPGAADRLPYEDINICKTQLKKKETTQKKETNERENENNERKH